MCAAGFVEFGTIYLFSEQNLEINENENAISEQIDSNGKEKLKIANITQKRIINANDEPNLWLSHGRNYEEQVQARGKG